MTSKFLDQIRVAVQLALATVNPSVLLALSSAAVLVLVLRYLGKALRRHLLLIETHQADLGLLGLPRPNEKKLEGSVVIIGGSIGGLLAARVCCDHFTRVVVVDAESWLASPDAVRADSWNQGEKRSRVLQYRALQGLFPVNRPALTQLFSNFKQECEESEIRYVQSETNNFFGGKHVPAPFAEYAETNTMPGTLGVSRRAYETLLRRLVFAQGNYPEIKFITGTVVGLTPAANDHTRIQGVEIRTDRGVTKIDAAFVVDSAGSGRTSLKWLERAGYGAGPYQKGQLPFSQVETNFNQDVHYATFELQLSPALLARLPVPNSSYLDACFLFSCIPNWEKECRSLYCARVESNRIHLCAGMWGRRYTLPRNMDQLLAWAQDLKTDDPLPTYIYEVLEALKEAEDTLTVDYVNAPPSSHTRFHLAANLPANYVALGDAVMKVNPVYAHGCTKAFYGVLALNTALHNCQANSGIPDKFSSKFFHAQKDKIMPMWDLTKIVDYAFDTTIPEPGEQLSQGAGMRWYVKQLQSLAAVNSTVASQMWHVNMMLAPAIDLVAPRILAKVLWHALWTKT